jgi:hypothetical protein
MTMTEKLPRKAAELRALADHYERTDTSAEMEDGQWMDPQPMRTTSLRLPEHVIADLRAEARREGVRYTELVRRVLESHVRQSTRRDDVSLADVIDRLDRVEKLVKG